MLVSFFNNILKLSRYNFMDSVQKALAIQRKIVIFQYFNGSRNMFPNTSEGNLLFIFLNNVDKTCLYGLTIIRDILIKYLVHFKVNFHLIDFFHANCLSVFKICLWTMACYKRFQFFGKYFILDCLHHLINNQHFC